MRPAHLIITTTNMSLKKTAPLYSRMRCYVTWVFVLTLTLLLAANWLTQNFAEALIKRGYWLENKVWKGLLLQHQLTPPELVLVGSSRVQNHFNTEYFNARGHQTFNYGVPGMLPRDYPFIVQQAAREARQTVVISLPAEFLFQSEVGCAQLWTVTDLKFYALWDRSCLFAASLTQWLQPLKFNGLFSQIDEVITNWPCQDSTKQELVSGLSAVVQRDICADTRQLMLLRHAGRWVAVFSNGDGLILPNAPGRWQQQVQWINKHGQPFNPQVISFLRGLVDLVNAEGKTPIFLIEAASISYITIDQNLEQLTGARTLYMNEMIFTDEEIADGHHLGAKGNERLTEALYKQLFNPAALAAGKPQD